MKLLLGIFLALSFFELYASEIRVTDMDQDGGLERSFVLETSLPDKVVLDCQSFIQGLRIGEQEEAHTYVLESEDCESLQGRMRKSLAKFKSHCIQVDREIKADYTCN